MSRSRFILCCWFILLQYFSFFLTLLDNHLYLRLLAVNILSFVFTIYEAPLLLIAMEWSHRIRSKLNEGVFLAELLLPFTITVSTLFFSRRKMPLCNLFDYSPGTCDSYSSWLFYTIVEKNGTYHLEFVIANIIFLYCYWYNQIPTISWLLRLLAHSPIMVCGCLCINYLNQIESLWLEAK